MLLGSFIIKLALFDNGELNISICYTGSGRNHFETVETCEHRNDKRAAMSKARTAGGLTELGA